MRKKSVLFAIVLSLMLISSVFVSAAEIQVTVDNQPVYFDQPPVIIGGRTVVPVAQIFRALGAEVEWDGETRTVYGSRGSDEIIIQIDNRRPTVNGQVIQIDVPATIVGGRTMVPARFIAESLNAEVDWNQGSRTVIIRRKAEEQAVAPAPEDPVAPVPQLPVTQENSRINPAKRGETVVIETDNTWDGYQKYEIELVEVVSGNQAWQNIQNANQFNSPPDDGMKYILAKFRVKILELEKEPFDLNNAKFQAVSKSGVLYNKFHPVVPPDPDIRTKLYSGAEHTGWASFMVDTNDDPVTVWRQSFEEEAWFYIGSN